MMQQQQTKVENESVQSFTSSAEIIPFPVKRRERWASKKRAQAATYPRKQKDFLYRLACEHRARLLNIGVDPAIAYMEADDMLQMLIPDAEQLPWSTSSKKKSA